MARYELRDRPVATSEFRLGRKALAAIAAASLAVILALAWLEGWSPGLAQHEQLVEWMRREGVAGPLVCIGVQFLQVVIFAIPGEITQFAAGYVFGATFGFAYSIVGILAGSAFNFAFAKALGRPAVERIVGAGRLARIDASMRSRSGSVAVIALFLMPGAPKDAMAYAAGLSALGIGRFLILSVPARMPALLASTVMGSQLYSRNIVTVIWIGAGAGVAIAAAAYYRWKRKNR